MTGVRAIVSRDRGLLMVKHRLHGKEWWCLPGGAVEDGESPSDAVLRELREECNVKGAIIRETSVFIEPARRLIGLSSYQLWL